MKFFCIFAEKFEKMESFKVGDRVNFLNDKGGGVIKKIIDTRMAEVEIEDGVAKLFQWYKESLEN